MEKRNSGFFPNLISVFFFSIIMAGMFFGFTRIYPELIKNFQKEKLRGISKHTAQSSAENLAPFVRGVIVGVKTSLQTSLVDNKPLNVTQIQGFQSGVMAALITARNWYNLDRQLFRVQGMASGFLTASMISKRVHKRGDESYQINLVDHVEGALSVDLEELLTANADDRRIVLENHVSNLRKLSSEANSEVENLKRMIDDAKSELELQPSVNEQTIKLSVEARKKTEILSRLDPLSKKLEALISAIEANFEALSSGVKVAPQKGVYLPILKE